MILEIGVLCYERDVVVVEEKQVKEKVLGSTVIAGFPHDD